MALSTGSATLLSFPHSAPVLRARLGAAFRAHRLPDALAAGLLRETGDGDAQTALAALVKKRLKRQPIDLNQARGILLVGPSGAGKSAVAAKLAHAARLMGRDTELARASDGLALFRTGTHPAGRLTIMEADGFNPLNPRAVAAFASLGEIEGVETVGVVSALHDAQDVSDIVRLFRFRRLIVTGLDRTRRLGSLAAAVLDGAGLAHVTRGPRPENALESLDPDALADLLLQAPTAH